MQRPPVPHRVITPDEQEARRFVSDLKAHRKETLQQAEILIVERDVETLYMPGKRKFQIQINMSSAPVFPL